MATRRARAGASARKAGRYAGAGARKAGRSTAHGLGVGRFQTRPNASGSHIADYSAFQKRRATTIGVGVLAGSYVARGVYRKGKAEYNRRRKRKKAYRRRRDSEGKFR